MKSQQLFVCIAVMLLAAVPASANFAWNFTEDLEGWADNSEQDWGSRGMTIDWEPLGDDNGMMVLTYDGVDEDNFRPRIYLFYWEAPEWNDSLPDEDGGVTGDYLVIRYRVVEATDISDRLGFRFGRTYDEIGSTSRTTVEEIQLGEWVTTVYHMPREVPDPTERLQIQWGDPDSGDSASYEMFEDGGRIEVDFIRYTDTPDRYLATTFEGEPMTWRVGPSNGFGHFMGYIDPVVEEGILTLTASDDPDDWFLGELFVGGLINEHVHLRSEDIETLYLHAMMRINADEGYDEAKMELIWREGGEEWSGPSFDESDLVPLTILTNEWVLASFPISEAPGYAQDVGDRWNGVANQWGFIFGIDRDAGWPVFPELQTVDFDYILFSPFPADQDSTDNGIPDYMEASIYGTDPFNPDTSGNGIPDAWLIGYGLDPLDPDIADQDLDGDGFTVFEEYEAGTDPLDPDSSPTVPDPDPDPDPEQPLPLAGWGMLMLLALLMVGIVSIRIARSRV